VVLVDPVVLLVVCAIPGTPDYMSPELLGAKAQHQQQALYDGTKADIWAAGVMLCVMLIGRFPFEGIEMSNATNLEEVSEHVRPGLGWHVGSLLREGGSKAMCYAMWALRLQKALA
jgi:serine/threonine protein kinase